MTLTVCFNGQSTRMEHSWAEHSGAGRTVPTINVGIWFANLLFGFCHRFSGGRSKPLPYRDGERAVICAKPKDGANNDADSRGRLSLQFIIMCGMPPKHLLVPPLFAKREDNILPYKKYTNFYGFTPKLVLHFVGTVRPAPLCSAQECSILVDCPLKQTARSIVTAANGQAVDSFPTKGKPWVCANNVLRRKIVQTTMRTVRQLVARTPCPYSL